MVSLPSFLFETRFVVSGSAFAVLCYRRDAQTACFLFGAICNALLSKVLKRLINISRPVGARLSDPGMPSSHAQSLFFFAAYLASGVAGWQTLPSPMLRAGAAVGLVLLATGLTLLRVRAGLHTPLQVGVGAVIGAVNGAAMWVASPRIERHIEHQVERPELIAALLVVGFLTVASVERTLGWRLKKAS